MLEYILKLAIMLPVIGLLAWACLKLAKAMQDRIGAGGNGMAGRGKAGRGKSARIVETTMLSPSLKLAVIEFHGREILVSASRNGLTLLAEAPAISNSEPGA